MLDLASLKGGRQCSSQALRLGTGEYAQEDAQKAALWNALHLIPANANYYYGHLSLLLLLLFFISDRSVQFLGEQRKEQEWPPGSRKSRKMKGPHRGPNPESQRALGQCASKRERNNALARALHLCLHQKGGELAMSQDLWQVTSPVVCNTQGYIKCVLGHGTCPVQAGEGSQDLWEANCDASTTDPDSDEPCVLCVSHLPAPPVRKYFPSFKSFFRAKKGCSQMCLEILLPTATHTHTISQNINLTLG